MKKTFSVSTIVALSAILFASGISNVGIAHAEPAVVIHDWGKCTFAVTEGPPYQAVTTEDSMVVLTNSKNGNKILKCQAILDDPPEKAVRLNGASTGAQCSAFGELTDKWHTTVSASGHAKIVCLFKADK
jgi:hypothetical protein